MSLHPLNKELKLAVVDLRARVRDPHLWIAPLLHPFSDWRDAASQVRWVIL